MIKYCKTCNDNKISNGMCNYGYFWCLRPETNICPACNQPLIDINFPVNDLKILTLISDNPELYQSMNNLHDKDIIEYVLKMSQFHIQYEQQKMQKQATQQSNITTKCPRCGNTTFTPIKKKWSMWAGFATNQVELVCNNCGYKMKAK